MVAISGSDCSSAVKVGVVGLGAFGRLHALTLASLTEAELVALVARRQASIEELQRQLPGVPGWTDLDKAIRESDAQAWVVAASTAAHVPLTAQLLKADKTVLLEKPVAQSVAQAARLSSLVCQDSSNLMIGHILLFNSEFRMLTKEVARRGQPIFINSVRHRPVSTLEGYPGETPFCLLMVHDLYMVQVLTGGVEPDNFAAHVHRNEHGAVDLAVAELSWSQDCAASLVASFLTPEGMAADGFDRLEVFGKAWAARMDPNPRPLAFWDSRARWPLALEIVADPVASSGMLAEELRAFCRVVRGVQAVPRGARYADALQVHRWLQTLESAAE